MGGGGSKGGDAGAEKPIATKESDAILNAPPAGGYPERPTTSMASSRNNKNGSTDVKKLAEEDAVAEQMKDMMLELMPFATNDNPDVVNLLTQMISAHDNLPFHASDHMGNTLLMLATQAKNEDLVALVIQKEQEKIGKPGNQTGRSCVNDQNQVGQTALHIACCLESDSYSIAERLLKAGADTRIPDDEGCTVLHYASAAGESSLVALLLLYGADASYTNTDQRGMAPLDYAVELNHAHCVKLLFTSGGARPDATDELLFWKEYVDPTSTRPYYHNLLSGETTWVAPTGWNVQGMDSAAIRIMHQQAKELKKQAEEEEEKEEAAEAKDDSPDRKKKPKKAKSMSPKRARQNMDKKLRRKINRWRRIAWAAGSKAVMQKARSQARRASLDHAKAQQFLVEQGHADSVEEQMKLKAEKQELLQNKEEIEKENAAIKSKMAQLKKQAAAASKDAGISDKQMAKFKQDLAQERQKADKAREQGERSQAAFEQLQAAHQATNQMLIKMKRDNEMASADKAEAEAAIKNAAAEREKLKREKQAALDEQNERLRQANAARKAAEEAREQREAELEAEKQAALAEQAGAVAEAQAEREKMAVQLRKEQAERRRKQNELEDLRGNIRVYARVRPLSGSEKERGCKVVTELPEGTVNDVENPGGYGGQVVLKETHSGGPKTYEFNRAFTGSNQEHVFLDVKRLVASAVDGFNVCIFAYGQTGSGKTFTMGGVKGDPELEGITPRACQEIFKYLGETSERYAKNGGITVKAYICELYKNALIDLLHPEEDARFFLSRRTTISHALLPFRSSNRAHPFPLPSI